MRKIFLYLLLAVKLPRVWSAAITRNDTALDNVVAEAEDIHVLLGHTHTGR
jgi:hypothetical protein